MNLNDALTRLKQKGYKYTDKREDMIRFFTKENGYRKARDLLTYMQSHYDGISFDTIYRNLHLFYELGILESTELDGEKHFRLKCDTLHHHHHFICLACGKTKEIHFCPMQQMTQELNGFAVEDHKFEIYGKCPECHIA